MKKIFSLLLAASAFACTQEKVVEITISNPSTTDRTNEITEITSDAITKLKGETFIISDNTGSQVPYQITYDNKIIFPVSVKGGENVTYKITPGTPEAFKTIACGKQYPERVDDIAWENDRIAFRTYGPALQATGEKAYGCDIWVKCVSEPIVDMRYKTELDPETRAKIAELRKTDPKAAQQLSESVSYHIDHGNGLDYYKVGPTLGAGVSALMVNDTIIYPWCYKTQEVLDNGPLRFTMRLKFNPLAVKGDTAVVETRLITLDAGSHLNRTAVSYSNLKESLPIVTGIVLHEPDGAVVADAAGGYMTYVDPTTGPDNGKIFMGAAFPAVVKEAKTVLFPIEEKKMRNNADGHVLVVSDYEPGADYVYYWGFAWDRADIKTAEAWNRYMADFAQKVRNPMTVSIR